MDSSVHFEANASSRGVRTRGVALAPRTRLLSTLALVVASGPLVMPNAYFYDVAILVAFNAIVCVGLNLLIGYAGQISLGHAGFFALGGYGTALLTTRYGVPPLVALAGAVAAVALLAFVVGRPILKLKGHYLAMATLGLGIIVSIVLATEDRVTGGPDGMQVPALTLLGFAVQGERVWYWIAGGALLATVFFASNLIDSPTGRARGARHTSGIAPGGAGLDTAPHQQRGVVV
jgi:branched-chain amino acid transport system permease protein